MSEFGVEFSPEQQRIEQTQERVRLVAVDGRTRSEVAPHVSGTDTRTPEEIAQRIQEHNNFMDNIDTLEPIPEITE